MPHEFIEHDLLAPGRVGKISHPLRDIIFKCSDMLGQVGYNPDKLVLITEVGSALFAAQDQEQVLVHFFLAKYQVPDLG